MMFYPPKFTKDHIIGCKIPYGLPQSLYAHFIYVHCQLSNLDSELKHRGIRDPGCLVRGTYDRILLVLECGRCI
jgi:hypothetical protein